MGNSDRLRIQGKSGIIFTGGGLFVLFSCFVLSFAVMGTAFARLFLALLILAFPLVLLGVLFKAVNWFEFDDDHRRIVRAFGRGFPYDRIKTIRIKERWGRSSFSVGTGWLRKRWLADGLNRDETDRVEQELARRFPFAPIRRKAYSNGMMAMIIAAFLLVIGSAYSGFIYYAYTREPRLFLMPEKKDWMAAGKTKSGVHYTMNGLGFDLPRRFTVLHNTGTWRSFEDKKNETMLSVDSGIYSSIFGQGTSVVRCLTGIGDSYDLFRLVYGERFGTLSTAMKIISFSRIREIKLYEIEQPPLRGFVLQGKKQGEAFAEIVVTDKASGNEIHFLMQQPGAVNERTLRSVVGSIKPDR